MSDVPPPMPVPPPASRASRGPNWLHVVILLVGGFVLAFFGCGLGIRLDGHSAGTVLLIAGLIGVLAIVVGLLLAFIYLVITIVRAIARGQ